MVGVFPQRRIATLFALVSATTLVNLGCLGLSSKDAPPDTSGSTNESIAPRRINPLDDENVSANILQLTWTPTAGAVSYEIHLGTDTNPPVLASTSATTYTVRDLPACSDQYWRIVATLGDDSVVSSPTWKFKTACP